MEIKFVGTGGAFEHTLTNSSAIVRLSEVNFLIDCGHSVFPKLATLGLLESIDGVLITHLHDDHVGSLSTLILYHQIILDKGRLKVYTGSERGREELRQFLSHSLGDVSKRADLRLATEITGVTPIDTFGRHVPGMQTFGYCFTDGKASIAYSGDNGDADFFLSEISNLALPQLRVFHEMCYFEGLRAHPHFSALVPWQDRFSIFGYHCDHRLAPVTNKIPLVGNFPELNF